MTKPAWQAVNLPEGMSLTKKEVFELAHPSGAYEVELFTSHSGECWAIGVPKNDARFIVYGSPVVDKPEDALQIVIQKISRETGSVDEYCGFEAETEEASDDDEDSELIADEP